MTPKQKRFIEEYRTLRNASEAARRAGYSEERGRLLLRRPHVIAALREQGVDVVLGLNPPGQQRQPRRAFAQRRMTALQQRFVEEYLIDGNATKAAIRAGLRGRQPAGAGAKMLQRRLVAEAIERERETSMARTRITRDRVLLEYARLAFADIGDVADWDEDGRMRVTARRDLSKDDRAAVAEINARHGKKGARTRVRMHSKLKALDALAKHLRLWDRAAACDESGKPLFEGRDPREWLRERLDRFARGKAAAEAARAETEAKASESDRGEAATLTPAPSPDEPS